MIEFSQITAVYAVAIGLKTNQIRKFLDSIRKLQNSIQKKAKDEFTNQELILLKVYLAYAKARQEQVKPFMMVVNSAIDKVRDKGEEGYNDFQKLVKFIEAIIAYHKYFGGDD